jgi:hypothetical protein
MTRHPVVSTNIRSIGYDRDTRVMEIEFVGSGKPAIYRYSNVSAGDHIMLVTAKSIGKHFGAHIKGKFAFERVREVV